MTTAGSGTRGAGSAGSGGSRGSDAALGESGAPGKIPVRRATLAHEVEDTGEVVVFDEQGNRLLLLNQIGAAVWLLIDGARDADAITAMIVETLSVDASQVAQVGRDVQAFVANLLEHGVIELR